MKSEDYNVVAITMKKETRQRLRNYLANKGKIRGVSAFIEQAVIEKLKREQK